MSTSGKHVMFFFRSMSPNIVLPSPETNSKRPPKMVGFKVRNLQTSRGRSIFRGKLAVSFREGNASPGSIHFPQKPDLDEKIGALGPSRWLDGWNHQTPMELVDGFGWIHMDITWRVASFKIFTASQCIQ